jgi:hypothetical protein
MPRREYFLRLACAHEGCAERSYYVFDRREDQRRQERHLRKVGGWRCVRHTNPDAVLSDDNKAREQVLVSYATDHGKFWRLEGTEKSGGGFEYGPGFKAFAKDFPVGTRLVVTAHVELPSEASALTRKR